MSILKQLQEQIETNQATLFYEWNALIPHLTETEYVALELETERLKKQVREIEETHNFTGVKTCEEFANYCEFLELASMNNQ